MKKNEQSLGYPWNTIRHTNLCMMGVPERREKGAKKIFEEMMAEKNPPNDERHGSIDPRSSMNPKYDILKDIYN